MKASLNLFYIKSSPFIVTAISRVISGFFIFFLAFIIAKIYGPATRGDFAIMTSISSVLGILGGLSLGRGLLQPVVMSRKKKFIYVSLGAIKTIKFSLIISLAIPLFCALYNGPQPIYFVAATFIFTLHYAWQAYSSQAFAVLGSLALYDKIIISTRSVFFSIAIFLIVFYEVNFWSLLLLSCFSIIIFLILEFLYLFKIDSYKLATKNDLEVLYKSALNLHLDSISGLAATPLMICIAGFYLTRFDLGVLALAGQFLSPLVIIPSVYNLIVIKRLSLQSSQSPFKMIKNIAPLLLYSFCFTLALIIFISIFNNEILSFFGKDYSGGSSFLIFAVLPALSFPFSQCLVPIWIVLGYAKLLSLTAICSTCIGLILGIFLIPKYGVTGFFIAQSFIFLASIFLNLSLIYLAYSRT
jgi:O-antigen/teichoic acid export membrane protein